MTPEQHSQMQLIQTQAQQLVKVVEDALEGRLLVHKVADHVIGIAGYIEAVAIEIKHDRERSNK